MNDTTAIAVAGGYLVATAAIVQFTGGYGGGRKSADRAFGGKVGRYEVDGKRYVSLKRAARAAAITSVFSGGRPVVTDRRVGVGYSLQPARARGGAVNSGRCDHDHSAATIRRLPVGSPGTGEGVFLCRQHWASEMAWRRERNRELERSGNLTPQTRFPIRKWPG